MTDETRKDFEEWMRNHALPNKKGFISLPPAIDSIKNGKVYWKQRAETDFELLGYFLTCHLIIEYYIDEVIKVLSPNLDWSDSRISYDTRLKLLANKKFPQSLNFMPAVRRMNSLRNKVSHQIDYRITLEDLKPLSDFVKQTRSGKTGFSELDSPREILSSFTAFCSAYLAADIAAQAKIHTLESTLLEVVVNAAEVKKIKETS